jgi:hypothetical protein
LLPSVVSSRARAALAGNFSADAVVKGVIVDTAPMTEHLALCQSAEISCATAVKIQFQAVEAHRQHSKLQGERPLHGSTPMAHAWMKRKRKIALNKRKKEEANRKAGIVEAKATNDEEVEEGEGSAARTVNDRMETDGQSTDGGGGTAGGVSSTYVRTQSGAAGRHVIPQITIPRLQAIRYTNGGTQAWLCTVLYPQPRPPSPHQV